MALLRGIAPSLLGISAAALLLLAGRAPAPPAALATVLLSLLSHIAVLRMCSYSSYPSSSAALLTGTAQRLAPFACLRLVLVGLLLHPTLDQSAGWLRWLAVLVLARSLIQLCVAQTSPRPLPVVCAALLVLAHMWLRHPPSSCPIGRALLLFDVCSLTLETAHLACLLLLPERDLADLATQTLLSVLTLVHYAQLGVLNGISLSLVDVLLLLHVRAALQSLVRKAARVALLADGLARVGKLPPHLDLADACPICLCGGAARELPCGHGLHQACLRRLVARCALLSAPTLSCPLCRAVLPLAGDHLYAHSSLTKAMSDVPSRCEACIRVTSACAEAAVLDLMNRTALGARRTVHGGGGWRRWRLWLR